MLSPNPQPNFRRFLRKKQLKQFLGDPSDSTISRMVAAGTLHKPKLLSPGVPVWDVARLAEDLARLPDAPPFKSRNPWGRRGKPKPQTEGEIA